MQRFLAVLAAAALLLIAACGHVPRTDDRRAGAERSQTAPSDSAAARANAAPPQPDTTADGLAHKMPGDSVRVDRHPVGRPDSLQHAPDSHTTVVRDSLLQEIREDEPAETATGDSVRTREVSVRADRLEGDVVDGERIRRLIGSVHLQQEETRLWSNRAVQFLDRDEILFIGDVLIVERGDTLRADSVLYDSGRKTGRADGDVRLTDGDVVVRAPSGLYFTRQKRAEFTEGVTMRDSTALLVSRAGEYWSDEKRAEFFGNVRLDEERTHLEADSVTYLRNDDVSIARGNVFIERVGPAEDEADSEADSLTRTLLFGDWAYNEDSTAYSRIEGEPLLIRLRQDSAGTDVDTLLIRASVLEASTRDSLQRLIATDSVRIWRDDLAATADSVVYDRIVVDGEPPDDRVRMYGDPMAWLQENQVSGDTLRVHAADEATDTLFVEGNAFVAREDSALQRIHQLRGESLVALSDDDSLRSLSVGPQAEAINFRTGDNDEPAGAVRLSADRIIFHFDGDEVERIRAIRGTEGTYYTEELMPADLQLDGFRWVPERRPTRAGLLGPVEIPVATPELALDGEPVRPEAGRSESEHQVRGGSSGHHPADK